MDDPLKRLILEIVLVNRGPIAVRLNPPFNATAAALFDFPFDPTHFEIQSDSVTRRILRMAIGATVLLLIPLTLTLLGQWHWTHPGGYLLAFVVLFGSGSTYVLVSNHSKNSTYRLAVGLAVGTACVHSWMNLVRVTESERAVNLLYYGVLAIGAIGALVVRFRPAGMARALFATAIAQLQVPLILFYFWSVEPAPGRVIGFGQSVFFATLFTGSALLFLKAAKEESA